MQTRAVFLSIGALALAACSGGSGAPADPEGHGTLTLLATDAPLDPALIEKMVIRVDQVLVHQSAEAESGFTVFYPGPETKFNLERLRNGVTKVMASDSLEAGTYRQFRIRVTGGTLELTNGNVYTTDDGTLQLASQEESGYKVLMNPAVDLSEGAETQVIMDFDFSKTFKPVPAGDPENAETFVMHPNIRGAAMPSTGELRMTVTSVLNAPGNLGVPDAAVFLMPPGETDPDQSIASTITESKRLRRHPRRSAGDLRRHGAGRRSLGHRRVGRDHGRRGDRRRSRDRVTLPK